MWTPFDKKMEKSGGQITIDVGGVTIGGTKLVMIAGPCAVESEDQIMTAAKAVSKAGAQILRGGACKPRTNPGSFQGLELEGYRLLRRAGDRFGLKVISEVMGENEVGTAARYCDILQVGARNMQNFRLLRALGKTDIPVLLKRGIAATISEWLSAAEYIISEGNNKVIFCERGIRTFETATRNTLDISAVPVIKEKSDLPIVVDPSHACGQAGYVEALSLAAIAAGADGLMIEIHPAPEKAMSDSAQQLSFAAFEKLCHRCKIVAEAVDRTL